MSRPAHECLVHVYSDPEACIAADNDARFCVMQDRGEMTVYHVTPRIIGNSNHWWCESCGVTTGPDA